MSTYDTTPSTLDAAQGAAPGFDPRRFKAMERAGFNRIDRKSTRLNSSH